MKFFSFLTAAAFVAGLTISSNASAATITYDNADAIIDASTYSPGTTLLHAVAGASYYHDFTFDERGWLAPNTRLVYTFTANLGDPLNINTDNSYFDVYAYLDGMDWQGVTFDSSSENPAVLSAYPIVLLAGFNDETLAGIISLTNITNEAQGFEASFYAYFEALVDATRADLTVMAYTSPVPLPPAFLMFASGLVALAAHARRKKNVA